MRTPLTVLGAIAFLFMSCQKDDADPYFNCEIDGRPVSKRFEASYWSSIVSGCQSALGISVAYGTSFGLLDTTSRKSFDFHFGQVAASPGRPLPFEQFISLFKPTGKLYDTLGCGRLISNKVVIISFTDERREKWSTIDITKDSTGNKKVTVNQAGSSFVIDAVKEILIDRRQGVKFKVRFNCILYEEAGDRQMRITNGEFIGQILKN